MKVGGDTRLRVALAYTWATSGGKDFGQLTNCAVLPVIIHIIVTATELAELTVRA